MKPICLELQERLAVEGAQALRDDPSAQRHLEECTDCFRVLEQLARLDTALAAMPAHDATDQAVRDLLARVAGEAAPVRQPSAELFSQRPARGRPWLWAAATAASVVLAIAVVTPSLQRARIAPSRPSPVPASSVADEISRVPPATIPPPPATEEDKTVGRDASETRTFDKNGRLNEQEKLRALAYVGDKAGARPKTDGPEPQQTQRGRSVILDDEVKRTGPVKEVEPAKPAKKDANRQRRAADLDARGVEGGVAGGVPGGVVGGLTSGSTNAVTGQRPVRVGGALKAPKRITTVPPAYPDLAKQARVQGVVVLEIGVNPSGKVESARVLRSDHPALDSAAIEAVKHWVYEPTVLNGQAVPVIMTVTVDFRSGQPQQDEAAQAFFQERAATEGLAFQPATGYWANTYLPGDPALRVLRARLRDSALRLHDAATQPAQPFDPPTKAGLALYLNADRSGLDKPSRMLLQVGLKGSPRSGGHRPPMNVGLVLDLRGELATEAAADMRALALAFAEARQPGDRFSLIVAGRPGGVVVGHDKFKHGVLAVALDRLMTSYSSDPAFDLPEALAAALVEAGRREDPDAALGGSAVVLVTSQGLGDSVDPLEDLAHQGAVAGIPLSVVSVGSGAPSAELDRLALTGQGSRRQLEARADAPRLVEAELAAASDVVARAVRLRIRLAPGVSLVEIVGSRRLDEAQAQRVRETERSIDLRLSRILGIDSDRGDDEDGIQVVIPSFHSGDAHVILLDVVAEGAGALADVSVRYKDVAFLRNGVARASLSLPARGPAAGPLERNVLKNLLAVRLAQSFAAAGAALDAGDTSGAAAFVERALSLRAGLLERLPGIAGDPELVRHVAMLQEYSRLLTGGAPGPQIADSLRYAGRLMLSPRPALRATGLL